MARRLKNGTHLYFPIKDGFTVQDSQNKTRYYLSLDALHRYLQEGRDYSEIVEYAPVVHGRWEYQWFDAYCSNCNYCNEPDRITRIRNDPMYCPNCGAKMDGERRDDE